ncbi:hypothetical protein A2U01_0059467, partial [Trifolium medium]|nr:hypothetical protein [Trifolium medium]
KVVGLRWDNNSYYWWDNTRHNFLYYTNSNHGGITPGIAFSTIPTQIRWAPFSGVLTGAALLAKCTNMDA